MHNTHIKGNDDLEHFAHIHPNFHHMQKSFSIDLNVKETSDPDNLDTISTIPYAGGYSVFTEVMPHTDEMMESRLNLGLNIAPLSILNSIMVFLVSA